MRNRFWNLLDGVRGRHRAVAGIEPINVTIVGDSHAELFDHLSERPRLRAHGRDVDVNVVAIKAATIRGFGRKRSTLDVQRKSLGAVRDNDDAVVFAYGQVDIELGYFYKLYVKREPAVFDEYAEELAQGYADRIAGLSLRALPIVKGVNLSVLTWSRQKAIAFTTQILFETPDDQARRDALVAELEEVFPSAEEVDRRHRHFNALLREKCEDAGIAYFDFVDQTTDPRTGRVQQRWVPRSFNHHALKKRSLQKIVSAALTDALERAMPPG